ncbi:uncharacterized protein FIBRA_07474 [Fibroporia radiculosa]|uniref:Glucose-methanol-choline oxidoreductase N-terminal domain-containing protein n=1 Tax=Fibroporia radiculosa TaxID=599839 RepID=J4H4M8_9APHY|nr:uncharacterized protein FIBRA_07474 [Fibroporia radiculosa]CCM05264.1 predicted protein [Fibroporia radiculosa]
MPINGSHAAKMYIRATTLRTFLDTIFFPPAVTEMEQKLATVNDVAGKHFDFVIIGAGPAGSVLANRLSENPGISVALLEAGKAHIDDPLIQKPDAWLGQLGNPEYDWAFLTVPQPHATKAPFFLSRGKGLGGSTAMNLLLWNRPQREDIDAFEKLGNVGWNFERFVKYTKKVEKLAVPKEVESQGYRNLYNAESAGKDGAVSISFTRTPSGAESSFQKSLENFGVTTLTDTLNGDSFGTIKSLSSLNTDTDTRTYAAPSYLFPVLDRPNLKVLSEAYVNKIIAQKDGEVVATGVEFEHGGVIHRVHATKEVIVSAGALKSPSVLEHSGIGDKAVLEPLGIPVLEDLPGVGANVQEHLTHTGLVFQMREDANIITSDLLRDPGFHSKAKEQLPDTKSPLSLVMSGLSFLPVQTLTEKSSYIYKKVEELIASAPVGLKEQYKVQLEILKNEKVPDIEIMVFPFSFDPTPMTLPFIALPPVVSHPFSRGTIHINSADPKAPPTIDPRYLEAEVDRDIILEATKFARKASQTAPFKDVVVAEVLPGPNVVDDDALLEHVKKTLVTVWHTNGSVSMLPKEKGGVVDSKLKVYGTKNIRVVDLSIVPLAVSAHTQSLVYSIAEMASDIIKEENGL